MLWQIRRMDINFKCLECGIHNFVKLLDENSIDSDSQKVAMKDFLSYLSNLDFSLSPPVMSKYYHKGIRELLHNDDPYYEKKRFYNKKILSEYDNFLSLIRKTDNPLRASFMLTLAGNIIDFGPNQDYDIEETIYSSLNQSLVIDHYSSLINDISSASLILYLLDNAGEIVFDKLFIERLIESRMVDRKKIVAVTRGTPVINDATIEDAKEVGLTELVKVIDTGDCTPGIIFEDSSEEFNKYFNSADLIISKGQGNFETLHGLNINNIYFLLIVKCPLIGDILNVPTGSFVCMKSGEDK